jgi:hypothetical protein
MNRYLGKKVTQHGTNARYSKRGCRCPECTRAHRDYQREWKQKRAKIRRTV